MFCFVIMNIYFGFKFILLIDSDTRKGVFFLVNIDNFTTDYSYNFLNPSFPKVTT